MTSGIGERTGPNPAIVRPSSWPAWAWGSIVFALAFAILSWDLSGESHYMDETFFVASSYYFDLFVGGSIDDPLWLDLPAVDHLPLERYLIGLALRPGKHPRPRPADVYAWYGDQSYRCETQKALIAARWPSVVLGAMGCAAIFGLGVLAHGRLAGAVAAALLLLDPIYYVLSRRAMSDVPAEALTLATVAVAVWSWRRTLAGRWMSLVGPVLSASLTGVLGGLAILAKLNGVLGMLIVGMLAALAVALSPARAGRHAVTVLAAALISAWVAVATFVLLNPNVIANPKDTFPPPMKSGVLDRILKIISYRRRASLDMQGTFPRHALRTTREKAYAVATQGFGRYGPLARLHPGPARRYDRAADRRAWVWGLWVLAGAAWAAGHGRRQVRAGEPPTAWAVLAAALVSLVTVTAMIPLDWDRYFLPIQSGSVLLAACAAAAVGVRLASATRVAMRRSAALVLATTTTIGLLVGLGLPMARSVWTAGSREVSLSAVPFESSANGWGPVERDCSNGEWESDDGGMISLGGVTYAQGLGVHAPSEIRLGLAGGFSAFRSVVGLDDETLGAGTVTFRVWADGRKLYDSGRLTAATPAVRVDVDVSGCHELRLVVDDAGDGNWLDHADWAGARLVRGRGAKPAADADH
jgi:NPCBM/NEW2 domain-containing protein/dolichyl-phosphate-mannose-protein mannosyltransferase